MDLDTPSPLSRRSFSLPVNTPGASPASDSQIEALYDLPSARIVSFSTSSPLNRPSSRNGQNEEEWEAGTLPWVSRFESTIAVGPLRIYRAPGSVAFLNCASALKPILPKSQAWCVDGDSKFVIQIRRPQYWRIEVSNKSADDKAKVEELKIVLEKVLLFEKTPCPFQRDFTVDLPERPKTPVAKRPWKPMQGPKPEILPTPEARKENGYGNTAIGAIGRRAVSSSPLRNTDGPVARRRDSAIDFTASSSQFSTDLSQPVEAGTDTNSPKASTDDDLQKPELLDVLSRSDSNLVEATNSMNPPQEYSESQPTSESLSDLSIPQGTLSGLDLDRFDDSDFSDATDDTNITPRGRTQPVYQLMTLEPASHERPQTMQNFSRSVTAPPLLSLVTSPPSKQRTKSPLQSSAISDSASAFSSSVESFHSVQSWHSPLAPPSPPNSSPPSPETYPYPHDNIVLPKRPLHNRDISELTITHDPSRVWDVIETEGSERVRTESSPPPKTPTLIADSNEKSDDEHFEVVTPPTIRQGIRHRATTSSNSRRRELSPLPAAVNLFSPTRRRPRRLQTARHLPTAIIQKTCEILLSPPSHLLNLMLNIASKIAAGEWRGFLSGHGEAVHWDFEEEYGRDGLFEDDYGMSPPNPSAGKKKSSNIGGSWEID